MQKSIIFISLFFCFSISTVSKSSNIGDRIVEIMTSNRLSKKDKAHKSRALIANTRKEDYVNIWKKEAREAADSDTEPEYLKHISFIMSCHLEQYIKKKESQLHKEKASKEEWIKHAYNLLLLNNLFYSDADSDIEKVTKHLADHAVINPDNDYDFMDISTSQSRAYAREIAIKAARESSRASADASARKAVTKALSSAVDSEICGENFNKVRLSLIDASQYFHSSRTLNAGYNGARNDIANINDSSFKIGKNAYRVAEKYFLLDLASGFDDMLILGAPQISPHYPENLEGLFANSETWRRKKEEFFSEILSNPDQSHFIQALIDNLDRLSKKIEKMSESNNYSCFIS